MATQTSLRYYTGIVKQSVKGTPVAPTTFPRWLDGATLAPKSGAERIVEGDGGRDAAFTLKKMQEYGPVLPCYPRPIEAGMLLAAAAGSGSDAITGSGPYVHTITPQNAPDWYTFEAGLINGDLLNRVADCAIDELTIEGEAGKPIKFTAKWVALTGARQATPATVTQETGLPMLFSGGTFTLDGAGSAHVEKFKWTLKNMSDRPQTNAVTAADIVWGRRTLDLDYTLLFQSDALYRKMFYGGASGTADSQTVGNGAFVASLLQGGVAGGGIVAITVPSVDYVGDEPTPKLDGKAFRYDVKGFAVHDTNPLFTAVVTNGRTTAY